MLDERMGKGKKLLKLFMEYIHEMMLVDLYSFDDKIDRKR